MPTPYIEKLAKKHSMSVDQAEQKWSAAKKAASAEGHGEDYAYITGVFKKMMGETANGDMLQYFADNPDKLKEKQERDAQKADRWLARLKDRRQGTADLQPQQERPMKTQAISRLTAGAKTSEISATSKEAAQAIQKVFTKNKLAIKVSVLDETGIRCRGKTSLGTFEFLLFLETSGKKPEVLLDWLNMIGVELDNEIESYMSEPKDFSKQASVFAAKNMEVLTKLKRTLTVQADELTDFWTRFGNAVSDIQEMIKANGGKL